MLISLFTKDSGWTIRCVVLHVNLLTHNMNSQYNPVLRILDISTPAVITEGHDSLYTTLQMQLQSIVCVFNYFLVSNAVYIVLM